MTYETQEAREILSQAREKRRKRHEGAELQRRTEAAADLLKAVVGALKEAGFAVNEKDPLEPSLSVDWFLLRLAADEDEGVRLHLSHQRESNAPEPEQPEIEYSPIAKAWVGKSQDSFLVPTPGAPFARQSAAGAVAEAIAKTLAKVPPAP